MATAGNDRATLERAVGHLEEAGAAGAGPSAGLLHQLAIAQVLHAHAAEDAFDLFRALDSMERAAALDSGDAAIRFDRALLLDHLDLTLEAATAWSAYLTRDSTSRWAAEARAHRARLDSLTSAVRDPALQRNPQIIREQADSMLVRWAQATLAHDAAGARVLLADALAAGEKLQAAHGDRSVLDAAQDLADASAAQQRRMAAGLAAWSEGRALYGEANYEAARPNLEQAVRALANSSALAGPAGLLLAGVDFYAGRYAGAATVLDVLRRAPDATQHLWIRGRAEWLAGLIAFKQGRLNAALAHYAAGAAFFQQAGETPSLAAMLALQSEANWESSQEHRGNALAAASLAQFRAFPMLPARYNLLAVLSNTMAARGLPAAAVRLSTEALRVAAQTGRPQDAVEALSRLVRAELRAGYADSAAAHLRAARSALTAVTDRGMHDRVDAELAQAEAEMQRNVEPHLALAALSRVVERFRTEPISLIPVLRTRGEVSLGNGNEAGARADFERVLALLRQQAADAPDAVDRAALIESGNTALDALLAIHVDHGEAMQALALLEDTRAAAFRRDAGRSIVALHEPDPARAGTGSTDAADATPQPHPDEAVLEYALLPDRLLIWAITRDSVVLRQVARPRALLEAAIRRLDVHRRHVEDSAAFTRLAASLYDALIAPVAPVLAGYHQLAIVANGALQQLPFAALRSARTGRWLIEDYALRGVPTAGFALQAQSDAKTALRSALLVGDPAFSTSALPDLEPLRGAPSEIRRIASDYAQADTLVHAQATREALLRALPGHDVLHFAGHARYRPDSPRLSFLVLAPSPGLSDNGLLYAQDIGRLDLRAVRLVVLSACSTLDGGSTRTAGAAALARAFLAAGVRGVVGSLWEVRDVPSTALMIAFHHFLADGAPPPLALQSAQRAALASDDAALRDPAAWAAFRFEGGW